MSLRMVLILVLALSLGACSQVGGDSANLLSPKNKVEGEVVGVDASSIQLMTEDGVQVNVVFNDGVVISDNHATLNLTDVQVGDKLEVTGEFDATTNSISAVKIEVENDMSGSNDDGNKLLVVGAGLVDAPTAEVEGDVEADSHVEIKGVVSSIAGNVIVVSIVEVEHSTADLGAQISVTVSDAFLKMGSINDITVGASIELKGTIDANNLFTTRVLKIRMPESENGSDDSVGDDDANSDVVDDSGDEVMDDNGDDAMDDTDDMANDDNEQEVKGTVQSIQDNVISVLVQSTDANGATVETVYTVDLSTVKINDNDLAKMAVGVEVEIEGHVDATGAFVISSVEVEDMDDDGDDANEHEVKGTLLSIDGSVIAVSVQSTDTNGAVVETTVLVDLTTVKIRDRHMAALVAGVEVELKGYLDMAGSFIITSVSVEHVGEHSNSGMMPVTE
ncbi:MAG: DUF5666 domain-containing protein [Gammaproteobacteria bacterium]|nr:DUF5666 domain-containing protein [Gammaproteobacteria bacterium]